MSNFTDEQRQRGLKNAILENTKPKTTWKSHIQKEHDIVGED